ncbi:hypothetical protein EMIT036CA2_20667 [Chryseobacterium sp. IT-36CA2]
MDNFLINNLGDNVTVFFIIVYILMFYFNIHLFFVKTISIYQQILIVFYLANVFQLNKPSKKQGITLVSQSHNKLKIK